MKLIPNPSHPAYSSFARSTADAMFGHEDLMIAWYSAGWEAADFETVPTDDERTP